VEQPTAAQTQEPEERADGVLSGYAQPPDRPPLRSYGVLIAVLNASFAASLYGIRRSGRELPERIEPQDLLLLGTASHKLSRLISKDKVTSVVRAPFTRYKKPGGPAEVEEKARGTGVRRAVGELITCPYCLDQWVASAFTLGLVAAPRPTRLVASVFTIVAVSDFLQVAYRAAENRGL
jgi:hypothetical protein